MFIIRRTLLAQPGRRDETLSVIKEMYAAMHKELGMPVPRIVTGSVGPSDSTIETETTFASLADFEAHLKKANAWPGAKAFWDKFNQLTVPGSGRFEILRLMS